MWMSQAQSQLDHRLSLLSKSSTDLRRDNCSLVPVRMLEVGDRSFALFSPSAHRYTRVNIAQTNEIHGRLEYGKL